uniref:PAR14-like first RRM domain-containing protein n=1 Tax=Falco tinnunculus TaxID=100819 RepID=A0A8C4TTI2_FALTI
LAARPGAFPLLVRGDWGAAGPPPALRKKLLCYFQSQKRSGGGECELRAGPGPGPGRRYCYLLFSDAAVLHHFLNWQVEMMRGVRIQHEGCLVTRGAPLQMGRDLDRSLVQWHIFTFYLRIVLECVGGPARSASHSMAM